MDDLFAENISSTSPSEHLLFQEEIAAFARYFEAIYPGLVELYETLVTEDQAWPDQYKRFYALLKQLATNLQPLCSLLARTSTFSSAAIACGYPLRIACQNLQEHLKHLLPRVAGLSQTYVYSPSQKQQRQREVREHFEKVQGLCATLQTNWRSLLIPHEARQGQPEPLSQEQKHSLLRQSARTYERMGEQASERGQKEEARACFERALLRIRNVSASKSEVSILNNLGRTYSALGWKDRARHYLQEALALAGGGADDAHVRLILNNLGLVLADLGEYEQATTALQQGWVLCQQAQDSAGQGRIYNTLGLIYNYLGQRETALRHYEQALAIRQNAGDLKGQGITLLNLGWIYDELGHKEQAQEYYQRALSLSRMVSDRWNEGKALSNLGQNAADLGAYTRALTYSTQALDILREVGDRWEECRIQNNLVRIHNKQGHSTLAHRTCEQALHTSRLVSDRRGEGRSLCNASLLQQPEHDGPSSLARALELCRGVGDPKGEGWILHNLGRLYLDAGSFNEAGEHFAQALTIRKQIRDSRGLGWTLFNLGTLALKQQRYEDALSFLLSARRIFAAIHSPDDALVQQSIGQVRGAVSETLFAQVAQRLALPSMEDDTRDGQGEHH
jgi:tetratricopeptide (TPR) repeat protein